MTRLLFYLSLSLFIIISSCSSSKKITAIPTQSNIPKADREFRAAWVATVANINWPSKPGLTTEEQQKEAIVLLDFLQQQHFNAVIFQVRPQADALYQSSLEPWSYYLTGIQGKAPDPYYDPLSFWTEAAHDRGLELHVWLNPYRAHHIAGGPISDSSLVKRKPELVVPLKEGYWWFDPSKKGTQDHSLDVLMDIVKRYDIDGVHFDDYFYPYPSYNGNEDFPDSASWQEYTASGGKLSRGDWRRASVNSFIERCYRSIKSEKPWVKFGLSPFGIWRPGYPESISGFDQYDVLFADARLWLNKGWVDYFAPQLYWPITRMNQSFPVLLGWWSSENKMNRHLWPGINVGQDTSARTVAETLNQIMITRGMVPESKGVIHWSISSVVKNTNLARALSESIYRREALVPSSPWLDHSAPSSPLIQQAAEGDSVRVTWTHPQEADVFRWVVYYQYGNRWDYHILNRKEHSYMIRNSSMINNISVPLGQIRVTAVDRTGNESR